MCRRILLVVLAAALIALLCSSTAAQLVFEPAVLYTLGHQAGPLAAGDVTGDGHVDLLAGNAVNDGAITVLVNQGDGTFVPDAPFFARGRVRQLVLAHLDADVHLDLVAAVNSEGMWRVHVARGTGSGTFGAAVEIWRVSDSVPTLAVGDVTGTNDGSAEIGVAAMLGAGDGAFGAFQPVPIAPGVFIQDLAVVHADDDAFPDLFATSSGVGSSSNYNRGVLAWRGVGDGTFRKGKLVSTLDYGFDLATGDWDDDGLDDAALGSGPLPLEVLVRVLANRTWAASEPFTDLGADLPGGSAYPILFAEGPLTPGETVTFAVRSATPDAGAYLVLGLHLAVLPFGGGIMLPAPDVVVGPFPAPLDGALDFAGPWPTGVPAGFTFWTQVWLQDPTAPAGYAATSTVRTSVP